MKPPLPVCCHSATFATLSAIGRKPNSNDALLRGAVAIALHEDPETKFDQVVATIDGHASAIRARVRGSQKQALLAHLHDYLFDEVGFHGNAEDYYNAHNSYLPQVLQTRRGLPITLSLIYKLVGERLGLKVHGIGVPGHFMCAVETAHNQVMLVDAYHAGRVLTADEAHHRMREIYGSEAEWSEEILRPVTTIHWLTRMLQNLLHVFDEAGRFKDMAAVLEMEMALLPKQTQLQRDLAFVLARVGMTKPASAWLSKYIKAHPNDPLRDDLKKWLAAFSA
jgi:regulator of sirC expression with transglutaminase-like and TPR domain